jgi:transposase
MSNVLKMAKIQSIQQLHAAGWSQRRIASELEIDRGTVARYLRPPPPDPKPAILPAGSEGPNVATFSPLPALAAAASGGSEGADFPVASKPAISPAGSEGELLVPAPGPASTSRQGRPGQCEPYVELIQAKLDQGLTAQRIWQDLVAEHGFVGRYDSVKRYVRRLGARTPLPFRRMECAPGEEAQVEFGSGAPVIMPDGKRRKTNVFRIVLSHSRKAYSEATFR